MSLPAVQKRKKRLIQLREAQRRRRNRLKDEKKTFLQIILTQEMQQALRRFSADHSRPMHVCAAELIEEGLSRHVVPPTPLPTEPIERFTDTATVQPPKNGGTESLHPSSPAHSAREWPIADSQ
jgi:hypothetical protein